jgi:hypothetical protein
MMHNTTVALRRTSLVLVLAAIAAGCGGDEAGPAEDGAASSGSSATGGPGGAGASASTTGGAGSGSTAGPGGAGGTGASTGEGGAGAGGAQGGAGGGCPSGLSDELDDPCTLPQWKPGASQAFTLMDIAVSTPGHLTIVPTQSAWFEDGQAWSLSKAITGDFVVMAHVTADSLQNPGQPPGDPYNSVGLLARDPGSTSGNENWIMFNVGFQAEFVGTEGKITTASNSVLTLIPGARSGRIAICRLGDTFHLLRNLDDEGSVWTEMNMYPDVPLPATLEVGPIANAYGSTPDLRGTIDYIRFATPASLADCTADIPPAAR